MELLVMFRAKNKQMSYSKKAIDLDRELKLWSMKGAWAFIY